MTANVNWAGPGFLDLEHVLDLGISGVETSKPAKPLACARCHAQKLRCVRRARDDRSCVRCLAANVQCVGRQPQRMGRPADTTSARHSPRARRASADRRRQRSAASTARVPSVSSVSLSPTDPVLDYGGAATHQLELDRWSWEQLELSPADASPAVPTAGSATQSAQTSSNSSVSSPPPPPSIGLTRYPSSLRNPAGTSNDAFFPSFGDLSSLFPGGGIDAASFEQLRTPETSAGTADGCPSLDNDPVESLSRLHLELYHCLVSVKAVEKMKRDRLGSAPRLPGSDIDTSWSENLFRTTERFIDVLRDYVTPGSCIAPTVSATHHVAIPTIINETTSDGREGTEADSPGSRVDTATVLMIVSCYTRLIQIFDVVVFVVETFRDVDCPGSYVQIRFGSFAPSANKTFQACVLGQYVLQLLSDVSEAVDKAVASRQPYAGAVAEVRRDEAKLRERIWATLR
ncbi:hypothetical protein VTK56DRAFT_5222 [Thermocarpiscus australiensis]